MAGVASEFLSELPLGDAQRTARHGDGPALAGLFLDHGASLVGVEESRGQDVGVVEVLDKGIRDPLLAGRASGAAVAAILRDQQLLASGGDRLEQKVVKRVCDAA